MKVTDKYAFFWEGVFSNFYPCTIKYTFGDDELNFTTSEQFFMWLKAKSFGDEKIAEAILKAETPKEAKKLGRKVKYFNDEVWEEKRELAMEVVLRYKFSEQNPHLLKELLDSKYDNKTFVEASPFDTIWGIGMDEDNPNVEYESKWKGLNLLGKCINKIREEKLCNSKV